MQQGSGGYGLLEPAVRALKNPGLHLELISFFAAAFLALVACGPPHPGQVFNAGILGGEPLLEA